MKQLASFAQKALNDPRLTYQVSVSLIRIISGGLGELVGPCVDDRVAINVLDTSRDALLELLFRSHPYVAQNRAGELGEEALDEVEPGAVPGPRDKCTKPPPSSARTRRRDVPDS